MKKVCVVCGKEFEGSAKAKMCGDACRKIRKAQSRKAVAVEEKTTKVQDMGKAWVLTVKNKKEKTFENIVFLTADVKVAHEFIDRMREEKVKSFVTLCDTERVKDYIYNEKVSKLMANNLKALFERKVPVKAQAMYTDILNAEVVEGVEMFTMAVAEA